MLNSIIRYGYGTAQHKTIEIFTSFKNQLPNLVGTRLPERYPDNLKTYSGLKTKLE